MLNVTLVLQSNQQSLLFSLPAPQLSSQRCSPPVSCSFPYSPWRRKRPMTGPSRASVALAPTISTPLQELLETSKLCVFLAGCGATQYSSWFVTQWGPDTMISDITTAAGWEILGCDPNALAQDIRIVCKSHDSAAAGCDHLFKDIGPAGKLVRLPENVGASTRMPCRVIMLMALTVREERICPCGEGVGREGPVYPRQCRLAHLPPIRGHSRGPGAHARHQLRGHRRQQVCAFNPPLCPRSHIFRRGTVSLAVQGSTIPGLNGNLTVTPAGSPHRRSELSARESADFVSNALASEYAGGAHSQTVVEISI